MAVAFISYFDLPEKGSFAVGTPRQYQMEEFFPEKEEGRVSKQRKKEIRPLDESIEVSLEDSRQVESSS